MKPFDWDGKSQPMPEFLWAQSNVDFFLKLLVLLVYVIMTTYSIVFIIPLVSSVQSISLPIFYFSGAAILFVASAFLGVAALFDGKWLGAQFKKEAADKLDTVSLRERATIVVHTAYAALLNILLFAVWLVWFIRNRNFDHASDFEVYSVPVVQFYVLLGVSGILYFLSIVVYVLFTVVNYEYRSSLRVADATAKSTSGKELRKIISIE